MSKRERWLMGYGRWWLLGLVLMMLSMGPLLAVAQEPTTPAAMPDAEVGLAIFAERCAPCHGETGAGDGEMAINLPAAPQAFIDPEYRRTALPAVMFSTIHDGRLASGMPPFGLGTENSNPIADANIWNLIGAVYSLATPAQSVTQGRAIYEAECAACHGVAGAGDGPEAAGLEERKLDLTRLDYWFGLSNEMVLAALAPGSIPAHEVDLSVDEQWAVVDYARTFSYGYLDPLAPSAPIEAAVISGQVNNGTTGDLFADATVRLRAFTTAFEQELDMTTELDANGRYQFDLEMVSSDWVYLTSVSYDELTFSSDVGQLSRTQAALDLPITVYEQTTDPNSVTIDQIHVIMEFFDGGMSVSEVYVVSNRSTAVFIGESGLVGNGTVQFGLPESAQNVMFERTMGSVESTIPATEIIETGTGYADTLPVRPGQGGMNLIVRYDLPYEDGVELSHPLYYRTANVTLILPDVGIELEGEGWNFQGAQQMSANSSFLAYDRSNLAAGSQLALRLRGEPSFTAAAGAAVQRNQTTELLVGGGLLLIALAVGVYVVRGWQSPTTTTAAAGTEGVEDEATRLIQTIASLDDAFEDGEIEEADYRRDRERLMTALKSVWR